MELELKREVLRFERFVTRGEDQVTIEGEATLPGSMRDAVTVLSVQAQAHIGDAQAGVEEAGVRGRVSFQVLYTQGDLTRIRTLETSCAFEHRMALAGAAPGMRLTAQAHVQNAEGKAASGRMTLRAWLAVSVEAFETAERELVADILSADEPGSLQKRMQTVPFSVGEELGTGRTLVREEFDLPDRLGAGDVLSAAATAGAGELSGGSGRVAVSGVIEVRVLHRAKENGEPLVTTLHELPYTVAIDAQLPEDVQPIVEAEIVDVMADSAAGDKGRTLRVEAEVQVRLCIQRHGEKELLEDVYSISGPVLAPAYEQLQLHTAERHMEARESVRVQAAIPSDAPPIGKVIAAFALPVVGRATPNGRRLEAEGVMNITLIYLPVDSDIPCAAHMREPFAATFPIGIEGEPHVHAYAIETDVGPSTSDRAELRCVLGMKAVEHGVRTIRVVADVVRQEASELERGFIMVWPEAGESRWDTARRLRVPESSLRPAGRHALLAFRR